MRQQVRQECGLIGFEMFDSRILVGVHFLKVLALDKAHKIKFAVIDRPFSIDYLFYHRKLIHLLKN